MRMEARGRRTARLRSNAATILLLMLGALVLALSSATAAADAIQISAGWRHACALTPGRCRRLLGGRLLQSGRRPDGSLPRIGSHRTEDKGSDQGPQGSNATIRGKLRSLDNACACLQDAVLKKGATTIGPKTASTSGAYQSKTKITKRANVRVSFAGTPPCDAGSSVKQIVCVA